MAGLHHLVEARIRDYERRKALGETRPSPEADGSGSLEELLLERIRELRAQGQAATSPDTRKRWEREAREVETQLLVLLESSGRPLAAQVMAERLDATRARTK